MAASIDFFQLYYDHSQTLACYPFAKLVNTSGHPDALIYFENIFIRDLIPTSQADLISVASWRLAAKRNDGPVPIILKNKLALSEEYILSQDFDVAVLTPRQHKDIRRKMIFWHDDIFNKYYPMTEALAVFDKFFVIPEEVDNVIYENHFIAKADIYKDYVATCLSPAISFMEGHGVFKKDSTYKSKKRNSAEIQAYQRQSGRMDWPIAPFILERLFCSWIQGKKLKVINL